MLAVGINVSDEFSSISLYLFFFNISIYVLFKNQISVEQIFQLYCRLESQDKLWNFCLGLKTVEVSCKVLFILSLNLIYSSDFSPSISVRGIEYLLQRLVIELLHLFVFIIDNDMQSIVWIYKPTQWCHKARIRLDSCHLRYEVRIRTPALSSPYDVWFILGIW